MMKLRWVALLGVAMLVVACNAPITGETSAPPPQGGPKASAKHPPGESQGVINQEKR